MNRKKLTFQEDKNSKLHSKKYFVEITENDLGLELNELVDVEYKSITRMIFKVVAIEQTTFNKISNFLYALVTEENKRIDSNGKCFVYLFERANS